MNPTFPILDFQKCLKHPGLFQCIGQAHLLGSRFGLLFRMFWYLSASLIP